MRILGLLLFLFFCQLAQSQRTFSSRAGDHTWVFQNYSFGNIVNNKAEIISKDSFLIKGKYYRKFDYIFIRDTGLKLFVADDTSSSGYMMFDFNLKIGDSIGNRFMFRVKDRKKIKLNSDSLIQITLENKTLPNYPDLVWIESIGCLNNLHPIDWVRSYGLLDYYVKLNCLLKNNENLLNQFGKTCLEHDLLNPSKKWHTWASNHNRDLKFSVPYYFTNHDTTLFGKNYRSMNQINRYVRYDTLASKYFILSNYNNGQELLVYSDKVKIGDTMAIYGTIPDTVVKIEYKWIEDEYRKVITTGRDVYISGVGSVNRVMWNNHLATFPEFASGNICFEESNTIRYHYPFFFQNKEQCEITSSIQNGSMRSVSFFPNPVQTSLNFNTSDKKEFKIRNSLGVSVLEGECEDKIDLARLSKGIYFIELQSKNQTIHFKFIKE